MLPFYRNSYNDLIMHFLKISAEHYRFMLLHVNKCLPEEACGILSCTENVLNFLSGRWRGRNRVCFPLLSSICLLPSSYWPYAIVANFILVQYVAAIDVHDPCINGMKTIAGIGSRRPIVAPIHIQERMTRG